VAEDSGLEIEALMGWPGVESKRVAESDPERIALVLERLEGVPMRGAQFVAATALALNGRLLHTWRGVTPGRIADEPRGEGGFGYDPVFIEPESGLSFAQLSAEQKNALSHRGRAWAQVFEYLAAKRLAL
jgi:XTP/dITP diphosphohydrolase